MGIHRYDKFNLLIYYYKRLVGLLPGFVAKRDIFTQTINFWPPPQDQFYGL